MEKKSQKALAQFLLRIALALMFLYAAIASFLEPTSWVGFFPFWLRHLFPETILLIIFSIYELVIAVWLLSGRQLFYGSLVAIATLLAITVTNITVLDIIFRDIGLLLSACALGVLSYPTMIEPEQKTTKQRKR